MKNIYNSHNHFNIPSITLVAIAAVLLLSSLTTHAKTASEVYEQVAGSTVIVRSYNALGKPLALGSGVVLPGGNIVTNCHVIKNSARLIVRSGSKEYAASLKFSNWERDACALSAPGLSANVVALGNTKNLKVGARVFAIGAPEGFELTLSEGIVSGLRELSGGRYIQTTAAISPGSSGGGLFDENGALVGLTTFYFLKGQSLNFALPVEWVKELLQHSAQPRLTRIPLDDALQSPTKSQTKRPLPIQPATQWLNKIFELEARQDWSSAVVICQQWLQKEPESYFAWIMLGDAYDHMGQHSKAIEATLHALRFVEDDAEIWHALGRMYRKTDQRTEEIEAYLQALRINPEHAGVLSDLGITYLATNQFARSAESFRHVLRINPENAPIWHLLGATYGALGQFDKSIAAQKEALRINPEDVTLWHGLGVSYRYVGKNDKVIEVYKRIKSLNPIAAEEFFTHVVTP